jgi:Putative MetA-pathway of phenol degradation
MFCSRTATIAVVVGAIAAVPRHARAEDGASDPRCEGEHSLWHPLPDACLGLIDTDRPHQTDTPHVVPAGHFQFESAPAELQLGGLLNDRSGDRTAHLVLFDDNYKLGLVSKVDLQLLFTHAAYDPSERTLLPPGPFGLRAKFNVVQETGWLPAITLVPWVFLPVAPSEVFRAGPYVFWGWELGEHFELEMNAGLLFGASPKPPAAVVLASALTYKPVATFGVFVDIYTTGPDAALGTGMLWAFTRDMQVDLGTYIGVHGNEPVATPFVGFSVRR